MPLEKRTRSRIFAALNLLGELAKQENVDLELCVCGGSAMLLAFGSRETTKDADAIVRPSEAANRLAKQVAEQLTRHESWLNDDVKLFLSDSGTFGPLQIQGLEAAAQRHLKIVRASASYLLAMKCLACRPGLPGYPGDMKDIQFLITKMNIRTCLLSNRNELKNDLRKASFAMPSWPPPQITFRARMAF